MYDDLPLNHPLRHLYRGVAGAIGLAMIGFGLIGLNGHPPLPRLAANVALAIVALLLGLVLVAASLLRRQFSHVVYLAVGGALMVVGLAMLLLLRTADFFGATMTTCLVVLTVGLAVFVAGTYTRTGSTEEARNRELLRRGGRPPARATGRRRPATGAQRGPAGAPARRPARAASGRPGQATPRRPASAR